ncbi:CopG family transcriptional regulator [Halodesulfurarchaeum formicicum]|uniref:Putative nickel-responsive regulator n=1 Tax=Halodesulfurarchaeum formicicum TaxID=1873524 RepID=A0A1D8S2A4_9EURY|nr:CopG family ribbon-helix-helix protein [Halodesulfurarchaeum formicicum]AOW79476.1 CopG family transcriptional regulator [Halodesulfurarchaeum formicicum]APE94728.1 CopG family transcriptional regulator [Halodesulfurarchaeum formicicum]
MAVVSISMPDSLLERLDAFAEEHGFTGRSEVLREAGRTLMEEFDEKRLEDRDLMAIVTVLFDYQTTDVEEALIDLRHEYEDLVASNLHSHVGENNCMELFVLEGDLDEISEFVGRLRATKDTLLLDHSVVPVDDLGDKPL